LNLQQFKLDFTGTPAVLDAVKVRYGSTTAGLVELNTSYSDDTEVSIGKQLTVYVYADIKDMSVT
jgi:predicted RNA-binding protein (virulence factor B family)